MRSMRLALASVCLLLCLAATLGRAQTEIDLADPEEAGSAALGDLAVRVRVTKTEPEQHYIEINWRRGGEGLGGSVTRGHFIRQPPPEPKIDDAFKLPKLEKALNAVGEWTTWAPLESVLGRGGHSRFLTITVAPLTESGKKYSSAGKSSPPKLQDVSFEVQFSKKGKVFKTISESSPRGATIGLAFPGKAFEADAPLADYALRLEGLSTYVRERRERLEKILGPSPAAPVQFAVLGHLGGYGEGGGYGVRHCDPGIVADECRTQRLLGVNGFVGIHSLRAAAVAGMDDQFRRFNWSNSAGAALLSEDECPFNPANVRVQLEHAPHVVEELRAAGAREVWAQRGDEIGLSVKGHVNQCPQCRLEFCEYLRKQGVLPEQVGARNWDEVRPYPVYPSPAPDAEAPRVLSTPPDPAGGKGASAASDELLTDAKPTPSTDDDPSEPVRPNEKLKDPAERMRYYQTVTFLTCATARIYAPLAGALKEREIPLFSMMSPSPSWAGSSLDWHEFYDQGANTAIVFETSNRDARIWQWESYLADIARGISARHHIPLGCLVKPHRGAPAQRMLTLVSRGATALEWYTYGPDYAKGDSFSQSPELLERVALAAQFLAKAEPWLYRARWAGRPQVAFVFPRSSELWSRSSGLGVAALEDAKWVYLALAHAHVPVDILSEQQLAEQGALDPYKVLYVIGPNMRRAAAARIVDWVKRGGALWTDALGLARDEANEPAPISTELLDLGERAYESWSSAPRYGAVRLSPLADQDVPDAAALTWDLAAPWSRGKAVAAVGREPLMPAAPPPVSPPIVQPASAQILSRFADGKPAVVRRSVGKGTVVVAGIWAGLTYSGKVRRGDFDMETDFDSALRDLIAGLALESQVYRPVVPGSPLVEAVYLDREGRRSVALMNWNYRASTDGKRRRGVQAAEQLRIELPGVGPVKSARSIAHGELPLDRRGATLSVTLPRMEEIDLLTLER